MSAERRQERDPDLEREVERALEGMQLQELDLPPKAGGAGGARGARGAGERTHRAVVVGLSGEDVIVELGPRAQGVVPRAELEAEPAVGQVLTVVLRGREDELWLCSVHAARELAAADEVAVGALVKARVTGQNTGGLELAIGHLRAFLPASHVALQHVEDLSSYLGQTLVCQVLEVDPERRRIVLSRRSVLESEREEQRREGLSGIVPGHVARGRVTRLEPFGAFVDLGHGVEGLIHVSNLSHRRVEKPDELLKVGDQVEVLVLEVSEGGRRIALSRKALEADPWDEAALLFPEGAVVQGKVVRLMPFGAFVELAPGIEGLLHVSQLGKERVRKPQDACRIGEELGVRVLSVDSFKKRIALTRLDERGAVLGSEEAVDSGALNDMLQRERGGPLRTNLGSLFKRALKEPPKA